TIRRQPVAQRESCAVAPSEIDVLAAHEHASAGGGKPPVRHQRNPLGSVLRPPRKIFGARMKALAVGAGARRLSAGRSGEPENSDEEREKDGHVSRYSADASRVKEFRKASGVK